MGIGYTASVVTGIVALAVDDGCVNEAGPLYLFPVGGFLGGAVSTHLCSASTSSFDFSEALFFPATAVTAAQILGVLFLAAAFIVPGFDGDPTLHRVESLRIRIAEAPSGLGFAVDF